MIPFNLTGDRCYNNHYIRTAELTGGHLCVCFPELAALLRLKKRKSGPSTSIVNGNYKKSRSRRQINRDIMKGGSSSVDDDGSYLELEDQQELGAVYTTREIKIDSENVSTRIVGEPR